MCTFFGQKETIVQINNQASFISIRTCVSLYMVSMWLINPFHANNIREKCNFHVFKPQKERSLQKCLKNF